jgi:hypothetical protein
MDGLSNVAGDAALAVRIAGGLRDEGVTVKIDSTVTGPPFRLGHRTTLAGFWRHGAG